MILRADFEELLIWPVPLVKYVLNVVIAPSKLKTDGTLVCLPARITFHFNLHQLRRCTASLSGIPDATREG